MTTLTDFTTTSGIRAALGVTSLEVTDLVLSEQLYLTDLQESLRELDTTLEAAYLAAKVVVSPTAAQSRFIRLTSAYSTYQVASQVLGRVALFAAETHKDASTTVTRGADFTRELAEGLEKDLNKAKLRLLDAFSEAQAVPVTAQTVRVFVANAALGLNPVTGV